MSMPIDPVRTLRRIEAWIARNHPDCLPFLRPGAETHTLVRIEARLGIAMPSNLRTLYAAHDGQPEGAPSLYLNQRWLPLELMAVAWEDLCLRYGRHGAPIRTEDRSGSATVQAAVWSEQWLPLFGSARGDHYCVDLRLEPPDQFGRVIWYLYDRLERPTIAQSIEHLLSRVADGVEAEKWHLDAGYHGLSD